MGIPVLRRRGAGRHQRRGGAGGRHPVGSPYLPSSTLETLEWGPASLVTGDVAEKIAELKRQPGKSIQIPGSPTLVQATLRYGLLDELTLMIAPIVVASGMRLFDEITNSVGLELADSRALGSGVLSVTYRTVLDRAQPGGAR
jgi:dihydrofolate reductase